MLELLNQMDGFDSMGDVKVQPSFTRFYHFLFGYMCYIKLSACHASQAFQQLLSYQYCCGPMSHMNTCIWSAFRWFLPISMILLQVIMATNRIDSLDPALIRPGRIDRKIEFPLPDTKTKRRIFGIHTGRMTLSDDVNLEEFIMAKVSYPAA